MEYEQNGVDRAEYGTGLLKNLAARFKKRAVKSLYETNLKLFRQFYLLYPEIRRTLSDESLIGAFPLLSEKSRTLHDESTSKKDLSLQKLMIDPSVLVTKLSFSHFIELFRGETLLKRIFYETETITNNWSVRQLAKAMDSMLFERTGLSKDKLGVLQRFKDGLNLMPDDVFRNPYLLDFLGLEEKNSYVETDLEQAIINHLQKFLLELGRGFCFEARQRRITFDNTHYRIDLVFYHRILKCHVLLDLKMTEFSHADAGQMNVYLNYYKENEMQHGDNPPVGIILCAGGSDTLVKYATTGMTEKIFVSKYLTNLPSVEELKIIVQQEQEKAKT